MPTSTSIHAARAALVDTTTDPATGLIPTAVAPLGLGRVQYGWGWRTDLDDLAVLLMDARSSQEARRSNRGRNEVGEIEVLFLAHSGRSEQRAAERAFDMLEAVDRACRLGDGLGGIVEEIVLSDTEYTVWSEQRDRAAGSFAYLLATFTTRALITG